MNILDKLRKLIAHEKSARAIGNVHEAEAFATKVQELMDEHKIGMTEVEFADREATEPIDWSEAVGPKGWKGGNGRRQYWTLRLARGIAFANECRVVCHGDENRYHFVGRTSNREFCVMLFLYMVDLGQDMCKATAFQEKETQYAIFSASNGKYYFGVTRDAMFRHWMKDWNKSWKAGFANAVYARLVASVEKRNKAATTSGAIVHIRKDEQALAAYMKKQDTNRVHTSSNYQTGDGYDKGMAAGQAVNLTPHRLKKPKVRGMLLGA